MHLLHGKQQIIDEQQVTKVIFKCLFFIAMFGFFFSKCQIRNAIKSASTSGWVFVRGEVTRHRVLLNKKKASLIISIKNITKKICFAIHLITYLKHSFTYTAYMTCDVKNRIKQFKQKKKTFDKVRKLNWASQVIWRGRTFFRGC